mgnify:CR=1 FL=1
MNIHHSFHAGLIAFGLATSASAITLPVAQDSASNTKNALTTTAGKAASLAVNSKVEAYLKFDVGGLPDAVLADNVVSARVVLYFSAARTPADLEVHVVTDVWQENVAGPEPAFVPAPAAIISAAQVLAKRFVEVDVTDAVKQWLNGEVANHGLAIVTTTGNVLLGAKEGSGSGYPAQLEILTNPALGAAGVFTFLGGNVGIGTAAPGYVLDVRTVPNSFGFAHTDGTRTLASFLSSTSNNASFGTQSNHALSLLTNNATRLTIDTSGRVGIGTGSPAQMLDVAGRIRTSGEYDGVIDFDAVTRDPAAPSKFAEFADSGDHLHPGDAGYKAMGDAIDLALFR